MANIGQIESRFQYIPAGYKPIDDLHPINLPQSDPRIRADQGIHFLPAFKQTPNGPVLITQTTAFPDLVRDNLQEYEQKILGKPKLTTYIQQLNKFKI